MFQEFLSGTRANTRPGSHRKARTWWVIGSTLVSVAILPLLGLTASAATAVRAGVPSTGAAPSVSTFTNAKPVFSTKAFAYEPGIGTVKTPVPKEKTFQSGGVTGEGQVQVAGNGDVFQLSPSSTDGLRRSTDGGRTWTVIQPPSTPPCAGTGYDHTIWVGAGRLFLAASDTPQVNMSDTSGTTWSSTCGQQAPGAEVSWNADRANIFGGPPSPRAKKQPYTGYPDMVYYCGQSVRGNDEPGTFFTLCEHSYDGGKTWTNSN